MPKMHIINVHNLDTCIHSHYHHHYQGKRFITSKISLYASVGFYFVCVCVCVEQLLNLMLSAQHLTLTIGTMIYSTYLQLIMCKYNFIPKTHFQRCICHTAVNCPLEAEGE